MGDQETASQQAAEAMNSIELSRGQKGTYAWTIKVRWPAGQSPQSALDSLRVIDTKLKATYPTGGDS